MAKKVYWRKVVRAQKSPNEPWRVVLACGHHRQFQSVIFRSRRLGCAGCAEVVSFRERLTERATAYDRELVRLLQGDWYAVVCDEPNFVELNPGFRDYLIVTRLLIVCDWLEEHGDERHETVRRLVARQSLNAVDQAIGQVCHYLVLGVVLPEIFWARLTDPTLWPFPDMEM